MSTTPPVAFLALIEPMNGGPAFGAKVTAYAPAQPSPIPPPSGGQPPQPIHPIWGPPGFNPPGPGMPPGIWGGPIIPPPVTPPGGPGGPPHVEFPIWGGPGIDFPDIPAYPPTVGGGPIMPPDAPPIPPGGNAPTHPINLPPPGTPPDGMQWYFVYIYGVGWVWVLAPDNSQQKPAQQKSGTAGGGPQPKK